MTRQSHSARIAAGIALSALALTLTAMPAPLAGQNASDTRGLSAPAPGGGEGALGQAAGYWANHGDEHVDVLTADHTGEVFTTFGKANRADAGDAYGAYQKTLGLAQNPKMPGKLADEGLNAASDIRQKVSGMYKVADVADKIANALNYLDKYTLVVKSAAYLSEGDLTGAVNVWFKDYAKKLMEKAGTLGLDKLVGKMGVKNPLWTGMLGTVAGEAGSEYVVEDWLEKQEAKVREAEYKDRYLNKPWMPAKQWIDESGVVHTLEPDNYVDPETGLIKRRSPEEQTRYEDQLHTKWLDDKRWLAIMNDLAAGKITADRYEELRRNFRDRDPTRPWNPDAIDPLGVGRYGGHYSGKFWGGGAGSVQFTITGHDVSGTISGVCSKNPCIGDPVSGSFSGNVSDLGVIKTRLTGHFQIEDKLIGPLGFSGNLNGMADGKTAGGDWVGRNKYGSPSGQWSAGKN